MFNALAVPVLYTVHLSRQLNFASRPLYYPVRKIGRAHRIGCGEVREHDHAYEPVDRSRANPAQVEERHIGLRITGVRASGKGMLMRDLE